MIEDGNVSNINGCDSEKVNLPLKLFIIIQSQCATQSFINIMEFNLFVIEYD